MSQPTQAQLNTFKRVGIDYDSLSQVKGTEIAQNWLSGETIETTPFIAYLVRWVYTTSLDYEKGIFDVKTSDFDRIRYYILHVDSAVYSACID